MDEDSYRALFVSDIHMNNNLPHAKPAANGRTDRLEDQMRLWRRVIRVVEKVGAEEVHILGDLFDHGKVDAVTLADTALALSRVQRRKLLLPGNHDANTIRGGRFNLEAFGHLSDGFRYLGREHGPYQPRPWLVFWPLEFMPFEETRRALHDIREQIKDGLPEVDILRRQRMDVLLFHNAVEGCTHGGWECDDGLQPEELCEGFDYVIGGHFHDSQTFGPDGRGMYLGAPMHHRADDAGRRAGFWVMDFKEGVGMSKRFFPGRAPRFHEYDWEGGRPHPLSSEEPAERDYIRIRVRSTHPEWTILKPAVQEATANLQRAGFRARYKHEPVYHHEARLKSHEGMEKMTMDAGVRAYVDAADVDTSGLDAMKLKSLGARLLTQAIRKSS